MPNPAKPSPALRRRSKPAPHAAAPGPAPTEASLHEAALSHLARYGTTRAGLARVLLRRVDRWAREAAVAEPEGVAAAASSARHAVAAVVARLAEAGAVNDTAFAASRARNLSRAGRSRRAVSADLASRGIAAADVAAALPDGDGDELAAAVATARRRRIGPFRRTPADAEARRRELAALARAGFSHDIAAAALRMDPEAAEALIHRSRQL